MTETIKSEVLNLINKYGTADPTELCECLDYNLLFYDLPECQNGFYLNINGKKTIVINCKVPYEFKNFYIAHEIGHSVLHENINYYFVSQNTNFVCEKFEREADFFAAELLSFSENSDYYGLTAFDISQKLGIPYKVFEKFSFSFA